MHLSMTLIHYQITWDLPLNCHHTVASSLLPLLSILGLYFPQQKKFVITVQNLKKRITCSLSVLCSPRLILTRSPQISGQNKSEAREPEGLVKITYVNVASSLCKRAGNSN